MVKFPIVERLEGQSEIDLMLNGFVPAHFGFDSTGMSKTANENCDWIENDLPTWVQDKADFIRFICLCRVLVIFCV
jgi:hypothetical protein